MHCSRYSIACLMSSSAFAVSPLHDSTLESPFSIPLKTTTLLLSFVKPCWAEFAVLRSRQSCPSMFGWSWHVLGDTPRLKEILNGVCILEIAQGHLRTGRAVTKKYKYFCMSLSSCSTLAQILFRADKVISALMWNMGSQDPWNAIHRRLHCKSEVPHTSSYAHQSKHTEQTMTYILSCIEFASIFCCNAACDRSLLHFVYRVCLWQRHFEIHQKSKNLDLKVFLCFNQPSSPSYSRLVSDLTLSFEVCGI